MMAEAPKRQSTLASVDEDTNVEKSLGTSALPARSNMFGRKHTMRYVDADDGDIDLSFGQSGPDIAQSEKPGRVTKRLFRSPIEEADLEREPRSKKCWRRCKRIVLGPKQATLLTEDLNHIEREAKNPRKENATLRKHRLPLSDQDLTNLQDEDDARVDAATWARFDLFFGTFVILNGLMMGYTTDLSDEAVNDPVLKQIEQAFLVVFITELLIRVIARGVVKSCKDPWTTFDVVVISISVIDLAGLAGGGGGSSMSILRIIRLLRLARLIRLLRLLKELWLLVMSIVEAMKTLVWAVLMLVVVMYITAIMIRVLTMEELAKSSDEKLKERFGSVVTSMVSLMQMTTYDGWTTTFVQLTNLNYMCGPLIFAFVCVSSLNIMNIIVGIMVHSAISVAAKDSQLGAAMSIVNHTKSARLMYEELKSADAIDPGQLTHEDVREAARNQCDVRPATIETIVTSLSYPIDPDEALEAFLWVPTELRVHTPDVLECESHLRLVSGMILKIEEEFRVAQSELGKLWVQLHLPPQQFNKACIPIGVHPHDRDAGKTDAENMISAEEKEEYNEQALEMKATQLFGRFDAFFGIFLVVNGVLEGVQTDNVYNTPIEVWNTVDLAFTIIFTVEFLLRTVLFAQIWELEDDRMLLVLPMLVFYPKKCKAAVRKVWCSFVQDPMVVFDLSIVLIALADNIVVVYLLPLVMDAEGVQEGVESGDAAAQALRLWRLVRLVRPLRLFRLFRLLSELWLLVEGLLVSLRTMFWTVLMLLTVIYMFGIYTTTFIGQAENTTPALVAQYGNMERSMFTLSKITTLDGWAADIQLLYDSGFGVHAAVLLFMLILTNLGLMNLIIGIMSESALAVIRQAEERDLKAHFYELKEGLEKLRAALGGKEEISRDDMEVALKNKNLTKVFKKCRLTKTDIWSLFDRVSDPTGETVDVYWFIDACVRKGRDVASFDLSCIAGRIDRLIYRLNQLPEKGTQVLAELAALKPHIQEAYDRMLDFRPRDMADEIKKPKVTGGMLWSHVTDETERLHRLRRLHRKKQQGEPERLVPVAPDAGVDARLSFEHWAATSEDFRSEAEVEHAIQRKRLERENRLLEKLVADKALKRKEVNKSVDDAALHIASHI
jgi:voltage-gated sodium channel